MCLVLTLLCCLFVPLLFLRSDLPAGLRKILSRLPAQIQPARFAQDILGFDDYSSAQGGAGSSGAAGRRAAHNQQPQSQQLQDDDAAADDEEWAEEEKSSQPQQHTAIVISKAQ